MSIPTTKQDNLTKDLHNISPNKLAKKRVKLKTDYENPEILVCFFLNRNTQNSTKILVILHKVKCLRQIIKFIKSHPIDSFTFLESLTFFFNNVPSLLFKLPNNTPFLKYHTSSNEMASSRPCP